MILSGLVTCLIDRDHSSVTITPYSRCISETKVTRALNVPLNFWTDWSCAIELIFHFSFLLFFLFQFVSVCRTVHPIEFQPNRFTSPTTSYYLSSGLKNKVQQSLLAYLLSQQAKNDVKSNVQILPLNQALSDVSNNSLNNKITGTVLNYVLPEESKGPLKNNLQSSLLSYLLQQESNRDLPFQQTSLSETANHVPLATIVEKPTMTLPSIPIATLSAVSRPMQTINYIPITLPRMSALVAQDSSTSTSLPLGIASSYKSIKLRPKSLFDGREKVASRDPVVKRNLIFYPFYYIGPIAKEPSRGQLYREAHFLLDASTFGQL